MPKTTDKVSDAAATVKPYFERALHDAELRDNVRNAYDSARAIYDELIGNRGVSGVAKRVATDRTSRTRCARRSPTCARPRTASAARRSTRAATPACSSIGLGLAILFNPITGPKMRKWLSEKVFGESGDFTYQGGNGSSH